MFLKVQLYDCNEADSWITVQQLSLDQNNSVSKLIFSSCHMLSHGDSAPTDMKLNFLLSESVVANLLQTVPFITKLPKQFTLKAICSKGKHAIWSLSLITNADNAPLISAQLPAVMQLWLNGGAQCDESQADIRVKFMCKGRNQENHNPYSTQHPSSNFFQFDQYQNTSGNASPVHHVLFTKHSLAFVSHPNQCKISENVWWIKHGILEKSLHWSSV